MSARAKIIEKHCKEVTENNFVVLTWASKAVCRQLVNLVTLYGQQLQKYPNLGPYVDPAKAYLHSLHTMFEQIWAQIVAASFVAIAPFREGVARMTSEVAAHVLVCKKNICNARSLIGKDRAEQAEQCLAMICGHLNKLRHHYRKVQNIRWTTFTIEDALEAVMHAHHAFKSLMTARAHATSICAIVSNVQ